MIDTLDLGGGRVQNHWKDQVEYILGLICTQGCLLVEYKFQFLKEEASSVTCTMHKSQNMRQYAARLLWNLANISKLWDSSGQDYPICNSKPKTLAGFQFTVTAKKCFVSTAKEKQ